jgi:hypothetical protein
MEIIIYALIIVLVLVEGNRITKLTKATDEDRKMLILLLKDKLARDAKIIGEKVDQLKQELNKRNDTNKKVKGKR